MPVTRFHLILACHSRFHSKTRLSSSPPNYINKPSRRCSRVKLFATASAVILGKPNFKGPDLLEQSEQCLNCYILHKNHPLCKQSRKTLLGLTQIDSLCWVNFHSLLSSAN